MVLARGRLQWSSGGHLGICPGGACSSRRHVQGGGDLLGMVGFSLDAQNGGVNILELLARASWIRGSEEEGKD